MKFAFSSVQGPAHKNEQPEVPRQDNGVCFIINDEHYVGIVSDGAGSSKCSHIASNVCVEKLSLIVKRDFSKLLEFVVTNESKSEWKKLSELWFSEVRQELLQYCSVNGGDTCDYNCTLILVIKTHEKFYACNVGDGRSGGFGNDGAFPIIIPFMTFTVGATYFLIKEDWVRFFRSYVVDSKGCDYFFISTDGPQSYLMDQNSELSISTPKIYEDVLPGEVYYDANLLYKPFFDGLILSLNELSNQEQINERLTALLEFGKFQLKGKTQILNSLIQPALDDDKTLIVFFNI